MTNYEKIKNMSVEEMAEFLSTNDYLCQLCSEDEPCDRECHSHYMNYLESEVTNDNTR